MEVASPCETSDQFATRRVDYVCKYFGNVCKIIEFFHNPVKMLQKSVKEGSRRKGI